MRENLQELGHQLLKEEGPEAWGIRVLEKLKTGENYVIEGMRNPGDVIAFRKKFQAEFYLVGIAASDENRFQRYLSQVKDGSRSTYEDFKATDAQDRGIEGKGQTTEIVFQMTDTNLENNSSLYDFKEKVDAFIKSLAEP